MLLFTGTLPNEPEIISVSYLKNSVYLNHWFNTKVTPNEVSELANTQCLILFTCLLHNYLIINLVE